MCNLFEVLAESYPQTAVPVVEHLAGHQGVKDGSTCEGYAEVEAKQPPVLCVFVELTRNKHNRVG